MSDRKFKLSTPAVIGFMLITDFILLDQLSKWAILEYVFKGENQMETLDIFAWLTSTFRLPATSVEIFSFFNLTMVWNEGISFGLFQNGNPWPLIILSLAICGFFTRWLTQTNSWFEAIALSMVIGGALGNVIDRLHFGAVADFIDIHWNGWHYPAFNAADSFISVGIVMLIGYSLFSGRGNKESQ